MLIERIRSIHAESDATYGMPRVRAELRDQGVAVRRKRVARLTRSAGIRGVSRRRGFIVTTNRDLRQRPAPDLVKREFVADEANQLWVASGSSRSPAHLARTQAAHQIFPADADQLPAPGVQPMRGSNVESAIPSAMSEGAATHRCRIVRMTICCAMFGGALDADADERILYKSVLRNGHVVYGDAPAENARSNQQITVERHADDPQEAAAAQRALALTREQLLRDASARAARLKQLDNEVVDKYGELQDAMARREQGREIQAGDRQGRRLLAPYQQRQRDLQRAVDQARQQLEIRLQQRAALQ